MDLISLSGPLSPGPHYNTTASGESGELSSCLECLYATLFIYIVALKQVLFLIMYFRDFYLHSEENIFQRGS